MHGFLRQILHGIRERKVVFLGQSFKIHPENGIRPGALPAGGLDGPIKNRFVLVGNDQVRVGDQLKAQAGAVRAGAAGIVEGEHPGLQLGQADAAVLAGVVLGKAQLPVLPGQLNGHQTAGMAACGFDGVRQPAAQAILQHQPVHHQLNGMLFVLLQLDLFRQVVEDAVGSDPGKALLPGILKHLDVLALFAPDHRGQHHKPGALSQGLHPVHNLVDGLAADFLPAPGAVGNAHPGPQKPQIVVDLRHRANGGPGAFGSGLLIDGNGGRQALNGVYIRLIHLAQKLPGVGAEALHIPALALGVDGIEGQAGFSGTAEPRKHHHFISGDGHIHIFQVILPGAPDNDLIVHSLPLWLKLTFFAHAIIPQNNIRYKNYFQTKFRLPFPYIPSSILFFPPKSFIISCINSVFQHKEIL